MKKALLFFSCLLTIASISWINKGSNTVRKAANPSALKEEYVSYSDGTTTFKGFIVYNATDTKKRPAVLVVPEWWGLNEYPKMRARKLADLGYVAMAVDMYGNGKVAATPDEAKKYATPFYTNPKMAKKIFDAALAKLKTYSQVDKNNIAAIGYCFGGAQVLNIARMGEDLKGVVSFHGNLIGVPADKKLLKAKILICHGDADKFTASDVAPFKKQMDSIGADYTFKHYANATHAFTNPESTEVGKKFNMPIEYNAAADKASWEDMKQFFKRIF